MMQQQGRAIGIVGTIGRVGLGLIGLYLAYIIGIGWFDLILGFIVFPFALLLWQKWRLRYTQAKLNATGPIGFVVNFAISLILFIIPLTQVAMLLFYGVSLLLAAMRGYAGCEVLAISNWLLKRDDQVGCVVFSPVDAVEARLTGKAPADSR
jgi:hypothetical protein